MEFNIQRFAGDYDLNDTMTIAHGIKILNRVAYLLGKKANSVDNGVEGDLVTFDSDSNLTDSGYGIATNEEFIAMLNEKLPVSPKLELSATEFELASGTNTDVTVTTISDGAITVEATTELEGITYEISDTTITFTNASATTGTGVYTVNVAGTDVFNPESATVTITATTGA